ncbi:MAG TPA: hypothetical protein VM283_08870 [Armatimonadota bacterium]|nr:hypothetical protein [Armatimonadota bacterium]
MLRYLACAALLVMMAVPAAAEDLVITPGLSPQVADENRPEVAETFRIRVVNRPGGAIEVSRDRGASWVGVGSAVAPATAVNPAGFTASMWAASSSVCATAVNAVHVKVADNPETGRGVIFSIIPAGPAIGAAKGHGSTSIATDIQGGEGIFGGGLAPTVNSPVTVERDGGPTPLAADYVPAEGDVLVISVRRSERPVAELLFENRFGGLIHLRYADGEVKAIGTVYRPVVGVGRFPGTVDAAAGRIRANHPGVIDISTAPLGMVGGFQIIPAGHAESPEMAYVLTSTQWMVVGPISSLDPSWEGIAPLFAGYLAPDYRPDDLQHDDWMTRLLSRCLVQVRIKGGLWQNMPRIVIDPNAPEKPDPSSVIRRIRGSLNPYVPLTGAAYSALSDVTHIRIILPMDQYWPAGAQAAP